MAEEVGLALAVKAALKAVLDGSLFAYVDEDGALQLGLDEPTDAARLSVYERWYTSAQVAAADQDYRGAVNKRLRRAAIPEDWIDRLAQTFHSHGAGDELGAVLNEHLPRLVRAGELQLVRDAIDLLRIPKAPNEQVNAGDGDAVSAIERRYINEFAERYPRLVDRARRLLPLSFNDDVLNEASRCYIYGFYRATVVLGAAAVERRLKEHAGVDRFASYGELAAKVFGAAGSAGSDPVMKEAIEDLFDARNDAAHRGEAPSTEEAGRYLELARSVVERLRQAPSDVATTDL